MSPLKHVHMDTSGLQTAHVVPEKQELKITVYSLPYYYRYLCNKDSPLFPLCVLKTFCCISLSFKKNICIYIDKSKGKALPEELDRMCCKHLEAHSLFYTKIV